MTVRLERRGSSKDIYRVYDQNGTLRHIRFLFSDRVSVLDLGGIPNTPFPGLGQARCAIAGYLFQRMNMVGFHTHYLSHNVKKATMDVYPLDIKELAVSYADVKMGRIIGIEIIDRRMITKKLFDRLEAGQVNRNVVLSCLGDNNSLQVNARFEQPFIECTTKYTDADRYVGNEEAATLAGVTQDWLEQECFPQIRKASDFLSEIFKKAGFHRHDGKFEGAVCYTHNDFIFADSMSPDEMRLIGPDGLSYDKDPVRQWYEKTFPDWYAEVLAAKKAYPEDRSKWPKYPKETPSKAVIDEVVRRYQAVAIAIGAI
jgi:phosphoribosylaminoimidazole-succinocarboxamide synthase